MRGWSVAAVALALAAGAARGEVVEAAPGGFQVKETAEIAAPAAKVWVALAQVGGWWNSEHTWSQDAKNLSLDLKPGGCWCETLPGGGGAHHMSVIFVSTGKSVILEGTLGPLMFSGASGHLVWSLAEKDGHTTLTQTYYVGGYFQGGLDKLAPDVDEVLTEQLGRLKAYVETGKPAQAAWAVRRGLASQDAADRVGDGGDAQGGLHRRGGDAPFPQRAFVGVEAVGAAVDGGDGDAPEVEVVLRHAGIEGDAHPQARAQLAVFRVLQQRQGAEIDVVLRHNRGRAFGGGHRFDGEACAAGGGLDRLDDGGRRHGMGGGDEAAPLLRIAQRGLRDQGG